MRLENLSDFLRPILGQLCMLANVLRDCVYLYIQCGCLYIFIYVWDFMCLFMSASLDSGSIFPLSKHVIRVFIVFYYI